MDGLFYAPFDFPHPVRRALDVLNPSLLVLVETELWPNLIHEARRRGTRIALVNGRISPRSFPRYLQARRFLAPVLSEIDLFLMQGEAHAERIRALGAPADRVQVTGNLKFDAVLPGRLPERLARLLQGGDGAAAAVGRGQHGGGRGGAGALRLPPRPRARAPGAPAGRAAPPGALRRGAALVEAAGFRCLRRSALDPAAWRDGEVLLLDTLGELAQVYALASVVFVGGSLVPAGGHNILEPAVAGKAVVVGPHMENFQEIADQFRAESAMVQVGSADELAREVSALLLDEGRRRGLGERARDLVGPQPRRREPHRGRALVAAGVRRLLGSRLRRARLAAGRRLPARPPAAGAPRGAGRERREPGRGRQRQDAGRRARGRDPARRGRARGRSSAAATAGASGARRSW